MAHNSPMVRWRSPWFPLACGTALLVLGVVARLAGGGLLSSVLLTLALPLLFEGGVWFGAAKLGHVCYDLDERVIHSEAYDPRAMLVRYAVICGLLFSVLIARELELLPDSFAGWLALLLTGFLWLVFVLRSYLRQITALARHKNVPLRPGQGNRR